jgi:hypothetical protein
MVSSKSRGGGPAPYYEPAMREMIDHSDMAFMKLLLDEAKIIKKRFGNIDAAIADLEAALKKLK